MGRTGVHPWAIISLVALYGAFVAAAWISFGAPAAALALGVVSFLGLIFFAIFCGGFLTSDRAVQGRARWFNAFLKGSVETWTGTVDGREAYAEMVVLPVALIVAVVCLGLIWRNAGG